MTNSILWGNTSGESANNRVGATWSRNAITSNLGIDCVVLSTTNDADNGPKFINPSQHDYAFRYTSALRAAGTVIAGVTTAPLFSGATTPTHCIIV